MAEAHSAVAFSFSITHDGYNINYNREVLDLVWESGVRSWKKRLARFRVCQVNLNNSFLVNGCFVYFLEWSPKWRLSGPFAKPLDCDFRGCSSSFGW